MTDTDDLAALKGAARKQASSARVRAKFNAGSDAASIVADAFLQHLAPSPNTVISAFLSIGSEIDTDPLIAAVTSARCCLCLPCVVAPATPLVFRVWTMGEPLVKESFGTRAPDPSAREVAPDILIVPLLAFDAAGYRLGYGGGFYDRSLDKLRQHKPVTAVGIGYSGQQMDAVPRGEFDQPLDWIITEQGAFQPQQERR